MTIELRRGWQLLLLLVVVCCTVACSSDAPESSWRELEPGLDLGIFRATEDSHAGDSLIRILRIDPRHFGLRLLNASARQGGVPLTAREWGERNDLVAAINASMYQEDHRTSVSLMRSREHVNNPRLTKHKAILAFDRLSGEAPAFKIINLGCEKFEDWEPLYATFVQSIRMVSCERTNVWGQQPRKWSTAAIGTDAQGRVLFVHVRSPYTTHDLIDMLLALPIGLKNLMYAEGGPEAQLYVRVGDEQHEFVGSFETGFFESDENARAWPVPNVVGVTRSPADD